MAYKAFKLAAMAALVSTLMGGLLAQCSDPVFAGGDDSPSKAPTEPAQRQAAPLAVPYLQPPTTLLGMPAVTVETPYAQWSCQRDGTVLDGRDDLMRYGCASSFGSTAENPAQDDISPN